MTRLQKMSAMLVKLQQHPCVEIDVTPIANGIAFKVTVPKPEQLQQLVTKYSAPDFVLSMLRWYGYLDVNTGYSIRVRSSRDGVIITDWVTYLDKKWARIWRAK